MTDDRLMASRLREIVDVSALITSTLDPLEIRRRAVEAAARLAGAERASLLLIDRRAKRLYFEVALGDDTSDLSRVAMVPGQGIAGSVLLSRTPVIVNDVRSDDRYDPSFDAKSGFTTRSMICVPVSYKDRPLGVLQVINKRDGEFDESDLEVTAALANHIAIALDNARAHTRLKRSFAEVAVYAALSALAFVAAGLWVLSLGG